MTWKERLILAELGGHFSEEDKQCSESWSSCAVGEQLKLREMRPENPMTFDPYLYMLGYHFWKHMRIDDIESAKLVYLEIEEYMKVHYHKVKEVVE